MAHSDDGRRALLHEGLRNRAKERGQRRHWNGRWGGCNGRARRVTFTRIEHGQAQRALVVEQPRQIFT